MGDHPGIQPSHLDQLSLAIRPWVGKISTGDGYDQHYERNGEFCVTVAVLPGLPAH